MYLARRQEKEEEEKKKNREATMNAAGITPNDRKQNTHTRTQARTGQHTRGWFRANGRPIVGE